MGADVRAMKAFRAVELAAVRRADVAVAGAVARTRLNILRFVSGLRGEFGILRASIDGAGDGLVELKWL